MQYNEYKNKKDTLITRFHYDAIEQLDTVTDTKGKQTISVYDMAGRRTQVTHPASGTTKFGYDASGILLWKYTANKDTIRYGYQNNKLMVTNSRKNAVRRRDPDACNKRQWLCDQLLV